MQSNVLSHCLSETKFPDKNLICYGLHKCDSWFFLRILCKTFSYVSGLAHLSSKLIALERKTELALIFNNIVNHFDY